MVLTITGTIKNILLQLQSMGTFYGNNELICTVIAEEKGDNQ